MVIYSTYFLAIYLAFDLTYNLAFYLAYVLAFYLTYFLPVFLAFYLTFILAVYLTLCLTFYLLFYIAVFLPFILAFYLTYILTFYLAFFLTFFLAAEVQRNPQCWAVRSRAGSAIESWQLRSSGMADIKSNNPGRHGTKTVGSPRGALLGLRLGLWPSLHFATLVFQTRPIITHWSGLAFGTMLRQEP